MTAPEREHRSYMRAALAASVAAQPISSPNPPVGAVVVAPDGTIVGAGHTQRPGGAHAEVEALRAAGQRARGATAYVTLEPCNHIGRTGPCSRALIDAGVAAVHYALDDPNPQASGGAQTLRDNAIHVSAGLLADEVAAGPLRPWLFRQRMGRPLVTAKIAATIDGRIAAPDGTSQWITGPAAREYAHQIRARIDALVVGTGTALADNPSLTARRPDGTRYPHQPTRVVLGRRRLPETAALRDSVAPTVFVDSHDPVDVLAALPDALWILVEGGPQVLGAFFDAGLVDEVHTYLAPTILGAGHAAVHSNTLTTLTQAHGFAFGTPISFGPDLFVPMMRSGPQAERQHPGDHSTQRG